LEGEQKTFFDSTFLTTRGIITGTGAVMGAGSRQPFCSLVFCKDVHPGLSIYGRIPMFRILMKYGMLQK